jgi:hypothetical protein
MRDVDGANVGTVPALLQTMRRRCWTTTKIRRTVDFETRGFATSLEKSPAHFPADASLTSATVRKNYFVCVPRDFNKHLLRITVAGDAMMNHGLST